MNTQEIKDLIAQKIAGQGTQVDVGGALPEILTAILEKAEEGGGGGGGTVVLQALLDGESGVLTEVSQVVFAKLMEQGVAAVMAAKVEILTSAPGVYYAITSYNRSTHEICCYYGGQELPIVTV